MKRPGISGTMVVAAILLGAAALIASLMVGVKRESAAPMKGGEFVCYDDGEVKEIHYGVRHVLMNRSHSHITLYYVDSNEPAQYTPRRGETCTFEVTP